MIHFEDPYTQLKSACRAGKHGDILTADVAKVDCENCVHKLKQDWYDGFLRGTYGKSYTELVEAQGRIAAMELTAADRCDRCGAQAYVKAEKGGLTLLLCAHHGGEHVEKLKVEGFTVHDERERLAAAH